MKRGPGSLFDSPPPYIERMGNFFTTFVEEESRRLHLTPESLKHLANAR